MHEILCTNDELSQIFHFDFGITHQGCVELLVAFLICVDEVLNRPEMAGDNGRSAVLAEIFRITLDEGEWAYTEKNATHSPCPTRNTTDVLTGFEALCRLAGEYIPPQMVSRLVGACVVKMAAEQTCSRDALYLALGMYGVSESRRQVMYGTGGGQ